MFFDDPVRAFTNIRRALATDGRAAFVSWQGLHANEWLMLIADAVRRHAELPEFGGQIRGPGMFAFVNRARSQRCSAPPGSIKWSATRTRPRFSSEAAAISTIQSTFSSAEVCPAVCSVSWTRATAMTYSESCKPTRRSIRRRGRDPPSGGGVGGHRPGIASDVFRHDAAVSNKVTGRHQIEGSSARLGVVAARK